MRVVELLREMEFLGGSVTLDTEVKKRGHRERANSRPRRGTGTRASSG